MGGWLEEEGGGGIKWSEEREGWGEAEAGGDERERRGGEEEGAEGGGLVVECVDVCAGGWVERV